MSVLQFHARLNCIIAAYPYNKEPGGGHHNYLFSAMLWSLLPYLFLQEFGWYYLGKGMLDGLIFGLSE